MKQLMVRGAEASLSSWKIKGKYLKNGHPGTTRMAVRISLENGLSTVIPYSLHGASTTLRPGVVAGGIAPLVVPYRIGVKTGELGSLLVAKALFKKLEAFLPLLSGNPVLGSPEGLVIFHASLLGPRPSRAEAGKNQLLSDSDIINSCSCSGNTIAVPGDDYLLETVENDLVSNFGTDTERVHTGGLLILTRTGYREYNATKEWHDEADSSTRPRLEFQLWRVAYRPGDDLSTLYQSATPVKDKTDKQTATFVIEANSTEDTQQISFEEMFNPIAGIKEGYLPKYDKEGYPYIYFTREYMSGEDVSKYKVVYKFA